MTNNEAEAAKEDAAAKAEKEIKVDPEANAIEAAEREARAVDPEANAVGIKKELSARSAASGSENVTYVGARDETTTYAIAGIRAVRDPNRPGRITWNVPADKVENFERHYHVQSGRVVRA